MAQDSKFAHRLYGALKCPELLKQEAFIGGKWINSKEKFPVKDPATQQVIAEVPDLNLEEVTKAIEASADAFPTWSSLEAKQRASLLMRWYELILQHQEDLAQIMSSENGKPLSEARTEVTYGAGFIQWFAQEAPRVYGDVIPSSKSPMRILVLKQAVGPCALITPWNFPIAMITRKAGAALAAGCPVVIKAASATPLSALALAHLATLAGFPPSLINVLTVKSRSSKVGELLCTHPLIKKITFTGSTEVGKLLMRHASLNVKRLSLELGGDAPFLVFEDADLTLAIQGAMAAKFRSAGQTCVCPNRFYIHQVVYEEFKARLVEEVSRLEVGLPSDPGVQIGPLINQKGFGKVCKLVDDAIRRGAKALVGGRPHRLGGTFYEPTVLEDVDESMEIAHTEIFGPVISLFRFEGEGEAISLANRSEYGLAAYFYSRDPARIWRLAEALEVGVMGANEGDIATEVAPFGGVKHSGFGREGSKYGMEEFISVKSLCWGGL